METRCFSKFGSCLKKTVPYKHAKPHPTNLTTRRPQEESGTAKLCVHPLTIGKQLMFSICSCSTKVIEVRGWRFAPACCAAQSVRRRGPGCATPLHRFEWAALGFHRHNEFHQPSVSAGSMKTVHASLSSRVRRSKWCGLTYRSTGPIAAGRHLGYISLAQMPARRNGPVSSNVRPHNPHTRCVAYMGMQLMYGSGRLCSTRRRAP